MMIEVPLPLFLFMAGLSAFSLTYFVAELGYRNGVRKEQKRRAAREFTEQENRGNS